MNLPVAGHAFVTGLHAAMAVAAGAFLIGALITAITVQREDAKVSPRSVIAARR